MTYGYKVMVESNSGKRPSWIWQVWWPQWAPASAHSKNEFGIFWSTSVPNFMLVDKSTQYPAKKSLRAWTNILTIHLKSDFAYCELLLICEETHFLSCSLRIFFRTILSEKDQVYVSLV